MNFNSQKHGIENWNCIDDLRLIPIPKSTATAALASPPLPHLVQQLVQAHGHHGGTSTGLLASRRS